MMVAGYLIIGIMVGLVFGAFIHRLYKTGPGQRTPSKEDTAKIMSLFDSKQHVVNNDVQNLLKISDATVTRYLYRLSKRGKITRHGKKKGTFYSLY